MTTYYVSKNGSDQNDGHKNSPFLTIQKAADVAIAGDTVTVHEGVYREWVKPLNPGLSSRRRIVYQAAKNEHVVIKGSEVIEHWEEVGDHIWKTSVDNQLFGDFNPFAKAVWGDWLTSIDHTNHLGAVYIDGKAMFEAHSREALEHPKQRQTVENFFTHEQLPDFYSDDTKYLWYADVQENRTVIYANFQGIDPNTALTEINVRPCCFFPERTGINYITVRNFEMAQTATQWAPPTGEQQGLIGPHWSKGWIIEDNVIHDSKCSGISLGKELSTGDSYYYRRFDKPGYTYQIETVFAGEHNGWSKDNVGSHIIRRNHIYNCGQTGIVGHMGCAFSQIYDNDIHDIATRHEFEGWEIAGIKLHAAIDTQIRHNRIYRCSLGTWLDWQAQGTRVRQNIYYHNGMDFFVEVSHGPFLIENNIFASKYALRHLSDGGAYVNNIIAGDMLVDDVRNRSTPYHLPHSTTIKGMTPVYGGDDRYFNNIFISREEAKHCGTDMYDGHPQSLQAYIDDVQTQAPTDLEGYEAKKTPVYINNNAYFNGAKNYADEANKLSDPSFDSKFAIEERGRSLYLTIDLPDAYTGFKVPAKATDTLPHVRIVDADFEQPDGSPLKINTDLLGRVADDHVLTGPIQSLNSGENHIKIW
ncbi:right-handed parallel beta-helix repeat-containing protein [Lentilactobacillus hilgardii]|nr:right-handed parallel beta-helix repeat-containing protein [Lentilactobacillus hilgardii]MCV3741539.1 right-handed parallel beta-helix repeat-containing protein [Lentilactobacillus hilgardii]